jgi:AcrR family transcriptional regulator
MTQPETKERILDAAERLFSDLGIRGVSLRAITTAARANLAAVNYHFGSKDELIKAVLARRIEPVNAVRLQRLAELTAGDAVAELEDVLDALLRPAFELASDPDAGAFCTRLIGRVQTEADQTFREFCAEQFQDVAAQFTAAIAAACPQLEPRELTWRFQFMVGSMSFTLTDALDLHTRSGGLCDPHDADDATEQLVRFAAAGFRAPVGQKNHEGQENTA